MKDADVISLARNISRYHRNSFRIRSVGKLPMQFDLPMCVEMDNLADRLSGSYDPLNKIRQITGLNEIIQSGSEEIKRMAEEASESGDAIQYIEKARAIHAEIKAAQKLMEMLNA